jgi:putative FmdB family regulatory protein
MPLYDHRCQSCDEVTETVVPFDEREVECEVCGGTASRVLSCHQHTPRLWEVDPGSSARFADQMAGNGASRKYAREKSHAAHRRWRDREAGNGSAHR